MHEGPGAFASLSTACAVDLPWPVGGVYYYTSCAQRPRCARLGRAQGGACKVYRQLFKNRRAARALGALAPPCCARAA